MSNQFNESIPVRALDNTSSSATHQSESKTTGSALITSPPVVQHPRAKSFGVSIAVSSLATAWVEYGFAKDDLAFTAVASHHGLVAADDQALHIRVNHSDALPTDKPICYRVVAQPLSYQDAYNLQRGKQQSTPVYARWLWSRLIRVKTNRIDTPFLLALLPTNPTAKNNPPG